MAARWSGTEARVASAVPALAKYRIFNAFLLKSPAGSVSYGDGGRLAGEDLRHNRAMALRLPRADKAVLLAPAALARAAALAASQPEERWLLRQPRRVRASYVTDVLEAEGDPNAEEIWMLRRSKAVRESYIREVLRAGSGSEHR